MFLFVWNSIRLLLDVRQRGRERENAVEVFYALHRHDKAWKAWEKFGKKRIDQKYKDFFNKGSTICHLSAAKRALSIEGNWSSQWECVREILQCFSFQLNNELKSLVSDEIGRGNGNSEVKHTRSLQKRKSHLTMGSGTAERMPEVFSVVSVLLFSIYRAASLHESISSWFPTMHSFCWA